MRRALLTKDDVERCTAQGVTAVRLTTLFLVQSPPVLAWSHPRSPVACKQQSRTDATGERGNGRTQRAFAGGTRCFVCAHLHVKLATAGAARHHVSPRHRLGVRVELFMSTTIPFHMYRDGQVRRGGSSCSNFAVAAAAADL